MSHRPNRLRALLEVRAAPEFGAFAAAAPAMMGLLPRANAERTVLVLPGFMGGDGSTKPLRTLLCTLGYDTHGWGLGRNIGPTDEIIDGLIERIDKLDRQRGPIDIIGWSLGGIYAREMARLAPSATRQVITLGSPFQTTGPDESNVGAAFAALRSRYAEHLTPPRMPSWARDPLEVPTSSIYTKTDGIVNWDQCLNRPLPQTENVEIYGSHCGLCHNPAAIFVIADRLAQAGTNWRPFQAPRALRPLFPNSTAFDTRLVNAA